MSAAIATGRIMVSEAPTASRLTMAIERHRRALLNKRMIVSAHSAATGGTAIFKRAEKRSAGACDTEEAAWNDLLAATPESPEELAEYARHLWLVCLDVEHDTDLEVDFLKAVLNGLQFAAVAVAGREALK